MVASVVMVQGTSSSVGKSLLVTALCRYFAQQGLRVAPFKAQNMSNNAAVCADGAEIGRSQAVQAIAAGVAPGADMNPILLKPEGEARSQVIVLGRPWRTVSAGQYYRHKAELWPVVTAALERLRAAHDLVVIEGAGSPAELNLQATDIVNMAVARYARAPVLLVGDIDRGGIFAQLLGTLWLLEPADRALVQGLIVNKFRGERALFTSGVDILTQRSDLPVLGVMPFLPALRLPEEDSATLDESMQVSHPPAEIDIAVIRLPRIANFDDFAPLAAEPGVRVRYVHSPALLGHPQAIILPGTKSTIADLLWLREQGLAPAIQALADTGTAIVGICGGYQMLGYSIKDPDGVESSLPTMAGLGLLPVDTMFEPIKATHQATAQVLGGPGWFAALRGQAVQGYEIHMGRTTSPQPWLAIARRDATPGATPDGTVNSHGTIWGCYLHGLFDNAAFRHAWLRSLGWSNAAAQEQRVPPWHETLDTLAAQLAANLDVTRLEAIIWG